MDIIIKIFEALINIPVPTILMIAGLAFIFIGIVGNFKGKFAISHNKQIICVVIGFCILLLGIALWWISDKPAPDAKTNEWSIATAEAAWSPRYKHTSIVFNDKMWVIGGKEGNHPVNDVWFSTDGVEWKQATSRAAWSPRSHHTSLVFDDKMWVIGGRNSAQALNDVWFSTDGAKWKQATDNAEWPPRSHHASVVFNDMVWVLGGIGSGERKNDVWFTSDGVNWQIAVANAPWAARSFHPCIVLPESSRSGFCKK